MELNEMFEKLREANCGQNKFSSIMNAKTVGELLEIDIEPEELLTYFKAAEELAKMEEKCVFYAKRVIHELKEACPVKRRRAFFI